MKNMITNNFNNRFSKVQEELKRLLSIVMFTIDEESEEQGFDYFINNGSAEDAKIAQYLQQDTISRAEREKNEDFLSATLSSKKSNKSKSSASSKVNIIRPISANIKNDNKNILISENKDGFDRD